MVSRSACFFQIASGNKFSVLIYFQIKSNTRFNNKSLF